MSAFLRYFALGCLTALLLPAIPSCRAQELESIYGPLPVFEFHSGFWVNLHHFLYHEARARLAAKDASGNAAKTSGPVLKPTPGATVTLTPAEQKTWDQVIAYYIANYAGKDLVVNIDLMLLKNQLGDFEDCDELLGKKKSRCDAGLPGNIGPMLEAAAPIYRAHWWADQDRANRRWVARVAPLVREQGVGLSERLADIYQAQWPREKIRVDVSAYANSAGAYTTLDPLRVTIASTDPRNQGSEALEVLFHEASHGIAQPVEAAISRECKQRDKPIPRNLWHALIIYTTGEVLGPVFKQNPKDAKESAKDNYDIPKPGTPDKGGSDVSPQKPKPTTVPYALSDVLTQRGWEQYHLLLVMYWQPYLDGKVNFEDAIAHLVSAA
jgi:phosphoglycolate phosphatase-like HAD superfamily hydrolase